MLKHIPKLNNKIHIQFHNKLKLIIHFLVVFSIIGSSLASSFGYASAQTFTHDPDQAIINIASEPFLQSPLRNRRFSYDSLITIAETLSEVKPEGITLPVSVVEIILTDNDTLFIDEGRILDQQVLDHDWDLTKTLVKLLKDKKLDASVKNPLLDGLVFLLRANKHIASLGLHDASIVLSGCEGINSPKKSECNQANAHLRTAETHYQNGIDALLRGDADNATHHFLKSWSFSIKVLTQWEISFEGDLDHDGLINIIELRLGSDVFSFDTDNDGLTDSYEFNNLFPHCMLTKNDTDLNGIMDGQEDLDSDGLSNLQESEIGTKPLHVDTDQDNLDDLFEIQNEGFNPLLADSDDDGLNDDSEFRLGTNPTLSDTDSDGIIDSEDTHFQTISDSDIGISIEITGVGDHSKSFQAHSLANVPGLKDTPGLIGDFISFSSETPIDGGIVRLRFDPAQIPNQDMSNLRLITYNPKTGELSILPSQELDLMRSEIKASFESYSPIALIYKPSSTFSYLIEDNLSYTININPSPQEDDKTIASNHLLLSMKNPSFSEGVLHRSNNNPTPTPEPTTTNTPIDPTPTLEPTTTNTPIDPTLTPEPTHSSTDPTPSVTPTTTNDLTPTPEVSLSESELVDEEGEDPPITIPLVHFSESLPIQNSRQNESISKFNDDTKVIIGKATENEHTPAVIFNPNSNQYLVAWIRDGNPSGIYGRFITADGNPAGNEFLLTNESVDTPARLELQYNSVDDTYLLAWQELNGQTSIESYYYDQVVYTIPKANLYTMPLNADGLPNQTTPNLITSELTDLDGRFEFDLVFNSNENQYLIAWVQPRGSIVSNVVHPHRLIAHVLDADGAPHGNEALIRIGVASDVRTEFSPQSNKYLITFSFYYPSNIQYAVDGLLLDADTLYPTRYIPLTNVRTGWQILPQIAYNPKDDLFFAAWYDSPEYSSGSFGHTRGQVVSASTGYRIGGDFLIFESPDEGIFAEMPGLGYSNIEDRYLVLGAYGGTPNLQGQYVLPDRSLDGDPFPIDTSAIQNAVAPRLGDEADLSMWFATWNYQGDIHGKTLAGTQVGELDSDLDGLTDAEEIAGFLNQFGQIINTDPHQGDTDSDGIPDGDEIGKKSGNIYLMISDPTLADTDGDDVEDFVELYALPDPTLPRDSDSDGDDLSDGEEVNIFSTDPWVLDSDGDEQNDGDEIKNDSDPLISNIKISAEQIIHQFGVGFVGGDFYINNPDYGTIPFLLGLLISGAISVIPLGVTQGIGLLADVRDLVAAFKHGDALSFGLVLLSLAPYIGDTTDVVGTIGRFTSRYPKLSSEVAVVLVRMDWFWRLLSESQEIASLRKIWSDEVIDALLNKGFDFARIVDLTNAGVDLRHIAPALDEIAEQFPGLISYLKKIPIDGQGILRGNGLTANLKGLANAKRLENGRSVSSYLGNIKGAYTQGVMKADRLRQGFEIIEELDLRHVNAAGYDLVLQKGGIYRIFEAKSGASLRLNEITNYIRKAGDDLVVDVGYFRKWIGKALGNETAEAILETGKIEIEFFINNPRSTEIAQELFTSLGRTTAKYQDTNGVWHTIQLIISPVTK